MEDSPYPESFVRTLSARLLFRGDDVYKPAGALSGGEQAKAALVLVFLNGCNVLLLDELTEGLDLAAREQLEQVLEAYPGTILFASHDRRFLERLSTHTLSVGDGQTRFSLKPYSENRL